MTEQAGYDLWSAGGAEHETTTNWYWVLISDNFCHMAEQSLALISAKRTEIGIHKSCPKGGLKNRSEMKYENYFQEPFVNYLSHI